MKKLFDSTSTKEKTFTEKVKGAFNAGVEFAKRNPGLVIMATGQAVQLAGFGVSIYTMNKTHALKVADELCKYRDPNTNIVWHLNRMLTNSENKMLAKALKDGADIQQILTDLNVLA